MKEYLIFHGGGGGKSRQRLHHREFSSKVVSALQDAEHRSAVSFKAIFTCSFDRFHYFSRAPLTVTDRSVQWTYNEYVHIGVVFFHCCYFRMQVCVIADIFRLSCFKPCSNAYAVLVVLQACSWVIVFHGRFVDVPLFDSQEYSTQAPSICRLNQNDTETTRHLSSSTEGMCKSCETQTYSTLHLTFGLFLKFPIISCVSCSAHTWMRLFLGVIWFI